MEACSIYYDETSNKSITMAKELQKRLSDTKIKAFSEKLDMVNYEENKIVGFVFESNLKEIPNKVKWVINHIVMDKKSNIFLIVSGGAGELKAVKSVYDILKSRGYQLENAYTEYLLEKIAPDLESQLNKIENDIKTGVKSLEHIKEDMQSIPKTQLRKLMRQNIKSYISYVKRKYKEK